jgi:flagellar protein FlgJ
MPSISPIPAQTLPFGISVESFGDRLNMDDPHSIARVAKDFESVFVSLVLKEMRQSLGPGSLFGSDTADVNGGLFDMFMSQHLVDAGGFGVAKMMEQALAGR